MDLVEQQNVEQQNVKQGDLATALRVQLGELLQRARLNQQKDGVDVARRLMLSKLQLLAIEAGQVESFHHERRYILALKSYVSYLNLDHDPAVSDLLKQVEGFVVAGSSASPAAGVAQLHLSASTPAHVRTYAARRPKLIYLGIGLLIVGAIALAISEGWPFKGTDEQIASAQSGQAASQSDLSSVQSDKAQASAKTSVVVTPSLLATSSSATSASNASSSLTNSGASSPPATTSSAGASAATAAAGTTGTTGTTAAPGGLGTSATTSTSSGSAAPIAKVAQSTTSGPALMRIDFNSDCWVSLQTSDGKKEERIYKQGQHLEVPASNVTALVLGNAPAAKMTLGSRQVDLMAKNLTQGNITRLDQKSLQALQKN